MSTSEGQRMWYGFEVVRGNTDVVWTAKEERVWVCSENDADDGATRKKETRRPKRRFMDADSFR